MFTLKAKIGLGIVATYTTITTYTYLRTQFEIQKRQKQFDEQLITNTKNSTYKNGQSNNAEDGGCGHRDSRFDSLTIHGRFENPFAEYRPQTIFEFFLMRFLGLFELNSKGKLPKTEEELRESLPIFRPDLELMKSNHLNLEIPLQPTIPGEDNLDVIRLLPPLKNRLTYTWLGQSCSIIQLSNLTFLTDPLFEDHLVSKQFGPKRITPSPVKLDELLDNEDLVPDFILVSHDHPDHLELESIKKLGNKVTWIVPIGIRHFLSKNGIHNIIEMNWWDKVELPNVKNKVNSNGDKYEVACLPAMHWSGRFLFDSNSTLWCSFMILKNGKSVFFHCGDTGYSEDLFKVIGEKYQPVRFGALPIGQYCPQWHQKPRHIDPYESLKIMDNLKIDKIVGIHWGTFILSSERYLEPKEKLLELAKEKSKLHDVLVPHFGKTMVIEIEEEEKVDDKIVEPVEIRNGQCTVYKK